MAKPITPEQLAKSGSEDGAQLALFCWCATSGISELKWLFHIPNGGSRHIAEASKLKAMGVKSGVPDLFLPVRKQNWLGLWIELKKEKRKGTVVSDKQEEWIIYLLDQGYWATVCYGWEEARDCLLQYLQVPMISVDNPQYGEWLNRNK